MIALWPNSIASATSSSFDLAAADLDHVDEVLRAGDDEVEVAVLELLDGRVEDELAVDPADANVGDRA